MSKRLWAFLAASLLGASLIGSSSASAATEFGNGCQAFTAVPGYTLVQIQNAGGNTLPAAAPVGGVLTKWKTNLPSIPTTIPQILKVFRPTGVANQFQVVGESATASVGSGVSSHDTRIPIQAGDHLGLFGGPNETDAVLLCKSESEADVIGAFKGNVPVGTSQTFETVPKAQIPAVGVIEPDADNDGFGDETQDGCPQSAAIQTECPVVVLDSFALRKKGSIVVLVAASETGPVSVSGTAKLPKGGKKKAKSSAKAKLKKVTKNVTAGKIGKFTLKFPGNLRSALAGLPPGKSITVKLQASAKDVAGRVTKDKSKLKLKGGS
jgi:hypothetical protein